MEKDRKLVTLYPEHGVAMLSSAFVSDPYLRCTTEAVAKINNIIGSLSEQGFRVLSAPPHLDSRDSEVIQFFAALGFRKRRVETYVYERNLLRPLPNSDRVLEIHIGIANMEDVDVAGLHEAMREAFSASVTQMSPLTRDELDSRTKDKAFLKLASLQAHIGDRIVSFVLVSCKSKRIAELAYQGTVPDCRRRGIGFHLLCESMRVLKDLGYEQLIVEQVLPQSKAEISLLEKAGFKLIHSQINMSIRLHDAKS